MNRRPKPRRRMLGIEALEPRRVMTTGISALLNSAGLLQVTGTDGDDNILFRKAGGLISIEGVAGAWSASTVKSIAVDLLDGNDFVSLASKANGGAKTLKKTETINSGSGNKRVQLANLHDVYFSGLGGKLQVASNSVATLNGTWLNQKNKVVAALSSTGVLTVTGTNLDDKLSFRQSGGKISIIGIKSSWSATSVKSIVVNLQDGSDAVSLDSLANGGTQVLQESVTIYSGNGNKQVHLADGHDVSLPGFGHKLTVAIDGAAALDGQILTWPDPTPDPNPTPTPDPTPSPNLTWFDSNVYDPGIRALANQDFVDGVLSRADMIGLLHEVAQDGTVSATEFADLQLIVNNASLFTGVSYVQVLAADVVLGSAANAYYLGQTLGNLKAGSTGAQLNNLVGKWFLGTDHPLGKTDWGTTFSYRQISGTLFVGGAAYTDVRQGGLGDCYFLASLAETALKNPSAISDMFIVNGDGTYTVHFFNGNKAEYVTVDSQLPTDSSGYLVFDGMGQNAASSSNELWVALAEKAYVQINEVGWLRPSSWGGGQNVYTGISGGCMYQALNQITGQATVAYVSSTSSFSTFAAAFSAGKSICLGSKSSPASSTIVGGHAYAVISVNTTAQTVQVFNPWGLNNGHDSGLITLNWAQIGANFDWYDRLA